MCSGPVKCRSIACALLAIVLGPMVSCAAVRELESAVLGQTGKFGGTSVTARQFVGWRFAIDEELRVDRVGGHLASLRPGGIFAAIVRLPSLNEFPTGAPFAEGEVLASTIFEPPFPSQESFVALPITLTPGSYALFFGTDMFGATGEGALPNQLDQPDIPPTDISSYLFWGIARPNEPNEWRTNLASNMRFVIEAHQPLGPCDLNDDGLIDAADLSIMFQSWGSVMSGSLADKNQDGFVDGADAGRLFQDWTGDNAIGVPVRLVPEAVGLAVPSLCLCALIFPRRKLPPAQAACRTLIQSSDGGVPANLVGTSGRR